MLPLIQNEVWVKFWISCFSSSIVVPSSVCLASTLLRFSDNCDKGFCIVHSSLDNADSWNAAPTEESRLDEGVLVLAKSKLNDESLSLLDGDCGNSALLGRLDVSNTVGGGSASSCCRRLLLLAIGARGRCCISKSTANRSRTWERWLLNFDVMFVWKSLTINTDMKGM